MPGLVSFFGFDHKMNTRLSMLGVFDVDDKDRPKDLVDLDGKVGNVNSGLSGRQRLCSLKRKGSES